MPRKRKTAKAHDIRISSAALAAWEAQDEGALHRALRLRPWEISPLDAEGECPWPAGNASAETWPRMVELRAELERSSKGFNSQPIEDDA